jgi:hypothetical protein
MGIVLITIGPFDPEYIGCYALWAKFCKEHFENSDWRKGWCESSIRLAMKRHYTTIVVNIKSKKRWEDVETCY